MASGEGVEVASSSYREQGNAAFKSGQNLKAAALYTKAIQDEPENAILYSNRSVALLNLNKMTKALADAEECIRLKPEWEKGYIRKAAVLEATERHAEALELYQHVHQIAPDNKEVTGKIRVLTKTVRSKGASKSVSKGVKA